MKLQELKKSFLLIAALSFVLSGCGADNAAVDSEIQNEQETAAVEETEASVTEEEFVEPEQPEVSETETEPEAAEQPESQMYALNDVKGMCTNVGATNIVNSGICCTNGTNYYYSDTNARRLYQNDTGTPVCIEENIFAYYLNADHNLIYYVDAAEDNRITVYNTETKTRTVICSMHAQELTLYNGKLYFSSITGSQKVIYRINTDGTGLEPLAGCEDLWYMNVYKDKIYFVNYENDIYSVVSVNIDGTDQRIIHSYNASDLCVADDKIFFSERDTRYLYSMNLDGSDVRRLNSTYSRCLNYMDGQLYYFSSEETGRTVYSCDLYGNITGKYVSGAKFIMFMNGNMYYYDWDEVLHIMPLSQKSNEENHVNGTDISSYEKENILKNVSHYIEENWPGSFLDVQNMQNEKEIWKLGYSISGSVSKSDYQAVIELKTGRVTFECMVEDILPDTVYLFDTPLAL